MASIGKGPVRGLPIARGSIRGAAAALDPRFASGELLANGDFSAGTANWSPGLDTSVSSSGGILTISKTVVSSPWPEARNAVTAAFVAGGTYRLSWQGLTLTGVVNLAYGIGSAPGGSNIANGIAGNGSSGSIDFVASSSGAGYITISGHYIGVDPASLSVDLVSLRRVA